MTGSGRMQARYRAMRARGHNWLARHPRLKRAMEWSGCLSGGSEAVARGIAVGLFVGLTPTVGFQISFMIAGCILLRGNFPAAFAVSWVSNPFTMAPLYWGYHSIGELAFDSLPLFTRNTDAWYLRGFGDEILYAALGSLLIALPSAALGYALSRQLSAAFAKRRARRRSEQASVD